MLDRTNFRKWLSSRGADYKTFMQELTEEGIVATPKSQKAYLGKDSPIKLGQTYVVGVNLNHPRLQGILDKEKPERRRLGLWSVKGTLEQSRLCFTSSHKAGKDDAAAPHPSAKLFLGTFPVLCVYFPTQCAGTVSPRA